LLAMDVNDNAGYLIRRGALATIASKLAPTGEPLVPATVREQGLWVIAC